EHLLAQDFLRSVEAEDERVQDLVFGSRQFLRSRGIVAHIIDFFVQRLDTFDRGGALGLHPNFGQPRMAKASADAASYVVGQSLRSTNVVEEPRREAAA